MPEKSSSKLEKLPVIAEALSKLLLPLVIAGVGVLFNYVQHRSDVEPRKADRVTSFIKHLASENADEKKIAIQVMSVLIDEGQLPSELKTALIVSATDNNEAVAQLSKNTISKLASKDATFSRTVVQTAEQSDAYAQVLPARVFIHISSDLQRKKAESLKTLLEDNSFIVPKFQWVKELPSGGGLQIRYYRDNEEGDVERIAELLRGAGLQVEKKNMQGIVSGAKVRPRTYEVWFDKDWSPPESES